MRPVKFLVFMIGVISIGSFLSCSGGQQRTASQDNNKLQAEAQRNLGEVYIAQGQYTNALQELLRAEALYADDPFLQNSLGTAYAAKGRIDQAIVSFNKALSLKPDYAAARNNLGGAYLLQKNWDAAITCLKELTKDLLYATPHYALYNIGWAYYNKKDYVNAEMYYQQALEIEPDYARAHWGLGVIYLTSGKLDSALGHFEKAVQKEPQFAQAYFDLGRAYEGKGNKTKAREAYERVITIVPNGPLAEKATTALSYLR